MVLDVLRDALAAVQALFPAGMGDVTTHDDGAAERQARCHGIFVEDGKRLGHGTVEVNLHAAALASLTQCLGDEFGGVVVEFLNPDALAVDFCLDVTVGRATHAQTDGARCAMARQTHDAHVVSHVFAAELRAKSNLVGLGEHLFFQFHVAEGTTRLVARGGQLVVVVRRGEFHGEQVLLGTGATYHKGDVIRRARCGAQRLHLLHQEGHQRGGIKHGLGHLVQIGLVGRAAALGHAQEAIFHAFGCLDVDLSR